MFCDDLALCLYLRPKWCLKCISLVAHMTLIWERRSCFYVGVISKVPSFMYHWSIWPFVPWCYDISIFDHAMHFSIMSCIFHHRRSNAWPALNVLHMSFCTPCNHSSVGFSPAMSRVKWIGIQLEQKRKHTWELALFHPTTCNIFPVVALSNVFAN